VICAEVIPEQTKKRKNRKGRSEMDEWVEKGKNAFIIASY
jgi:hypothetical protein